MITGTANSASITMSNKSGDTEQIDEVSIPWAKTLGAMDCYKFLYISAQNQGETGYVACQIFADSEIVATSRSDGAYVIATCSD